MADKHSVQAAFAKMQGVAMKAGVGIYGLSKLERVQHPLVERKVWVIRRPNTALPTTIGRTSNEAVCYLVGLTAGFADVNAVREEMARR